MVALQTTSVNAFQWSLSRRMQWSAEPIGSVGAGAVALRGSEPRSPTRNDAPKHGVWLLFRGERHEPDGKRSAEGLAQRALILYLKHLTFTGDQ